MIATIMFVVDSLTIEQECLIEFPLLNLIDTIFITNITCIVLNLN